MTRTTNARIAGAAFLLYIVVGVAQMTVLGGTTAGDSLAARLATMSAHAGDVRINLVLGMSTCLLALTLAVTLWALTREADPDLAMLGLSCRAGEGVVAASVLPITMSLLALVTATGADTPDTAATEAVASLVFGARRWTVVVSAIFFSVGSLIFTAIMLRGRIIPRALAWAGVLASVLLVVGLPLQLAGVVRAPWTDIMWIPMAAFEIPLGAWLLIKGAPSPATRPGPLAGPSLQGVVR